MDGKYLTKSFWESKDDEYLERACEALMGSGSQGDRDPNLNPLAWAKATPSDRMNVLETIMQVIDERASATQALYK